ncbi:hypothetical protein ABZU76_18130 [Amycolatopsis sp. NPDC005232]|uniref:hypothetical protein n=1 Tax=Amycolatopsis sp. NPDC005232 TaxID=3157027 RepID=UPI0033B960F4
MLKKVIAALGAAGAVTVGLAVPAGAQPLAAPNCQNSSGYGTVVATVPISAVTGGARVGTVELCRDSAYNYWGSRSTRAR